MSNRSQPSIERVPLGWDEPPVATAAAWLAERFGADMDGVLVAQPGARGGRLLRERLARLIGPSWRPPTFLTAGRTSDELLAIEGRPASRLVRTLAWARALRDLEPHALRRLVARPPEPREHAAWFRLAEEVRALFGEVAAEGLGFADVARGDALPAEAEGERARWRALADAQQRMADALTAEGLVDPHLARLTAIEQRAVTAPRAVVLVGVVESNGLLRRALELCDCERAALVFAPADLLDGFDEVGALTPARWIDRGTSITTDDWRVVDGPDQQAAAALDAIARFDGRYAAERITLGVAGAEVAPYLRRRLAAQGVHARDAAGVPVSRSLPARLVDAVAAYLDGRRFAEYAALVRHPDVEARLRVDAPDVDPAATLDAHHQEHLPGYADGEWSGREGGRLAALADAVHALFGELDDEATRPLAAWGPAVRAMLSRVYEGREWDDEVPAERALAEALARVGRAVQELEELPDALDEPVTAHAALAVVSRLCATQAIPEPAAPDGAPTIEMLGWLELAMDDAPAVVVTGMNDGDVPASRRGDAFLPDGLRRSLGLDADEARLARDLWAAEVIVHSREAHVFVTGRRSRAGDPLLPSRVLFHRDDAEVVERVGHFLAGGGHEDARTDEDPRPRELPRMPRDPEVESISVTSFKTFLTSPYAYYLTRVLGLESGDDRARELDARNFGILAHDVLEQWGRDEAARDRDDPERVARDLVGRMRGLARQRFGERPLPAVALQLEQLAWRLERFAARQADWYAQGWRVRHVEWSPEGGGVRFEVDGAPIRLSGRVDRVDVNVETGGVALLDYKTGDRAADPLRAHRKQDGDWRDLQLPLYTHLARSLTGGAQPTLGYVTLGKDERQIGFATIERFAPTKKSTETFAEGVEAALEVARDVVRRIRARDWFDVGDRWPLGEPAFAALGGQGLLATSADGDLEGGE